MPQIRIQQFTFQLSSRYAPGHILDEVEALALEGLRAENIRNIVWRRVRAELDRLPDGEAPDRQLISRLESFVSELDDSYRFGTKRPYLSLAGTIEGEARQIARERLSPVASQDEILALAGQDEVREEARERLALRQRIAGEAIADLL